LRELQILLFKMKKRFSKFWNSSTKARKQRKYVFNAPLNIRHKLCSSSLSSELRKTYSIRSVPVRKGDFVKIESGQFRGKSGKVTKVMLSRMRIHVEGAVIKRADGTDSFYPVHPSNVQITKLETSDKLRVEKIERNKNNK